jgi:DNA invertase Pin-like site-specific DNA recombinase
MPRRKPLKPVISYRRVSTERQGLEGIGLEGQSAAITAGAEAGGYTVVADYQDIASGRGATSWKTREGLQAAIRDAKARKCPIIVSGLDRLSRDAKTAERIVGSEGLTIVSVTEGDIMNPVVLASRAARHEQDGQMISDRTKAALQERKASGQRLGNPTNLREAQQKGSQRSSEKAAKRVRAIADLIESRGMVNASAAEVVAALNEEGILTGRSEPWTLAGVRRPLRSARALLTERSDARYKDNPLAGSF